MKKWTEQEMCEHGWAIWYYGGWHVGLGAPKGLSRDEHYDYLDRKKEFINSLPERFNKLQEQNTVLTKALQKIHDLGNTRSGKSAKSRIAYEILVELGLPLENGDD